MDDEQRDGQGDRKRDVLDTSGDGLLKAELLRIRAYLLLWVGPAVLVLLRYALGVVTDHTELPKLIVAELEKPLESNGLLFALGLALGSFVTALALGATASARVVAEDMGSVFYLAGTFCIVFVTAVSVIHMRFHLEAMWAVGIGLLAIVTGMLLQTLGEAAVRKRESKHALRWMKQEWFRRWRC